MTISNSSLPAAIRAFDWRHAERALVAVGQPAVGVAVAVSPGLLVTTASTVLKANTGKTGNLSVKAAALDDFKWRGAQVGVLSCDIATDLALLGSTPGIDDDGLDDLLRERELLEVAELVLGDAMVLHIPTVSGLWARLPGVVTSDLEITIAARPVDEDAAAAVAEWAGMPAFSDDGRLAGFVIRASTPVLVRRVDHVVHRGAHRGTDDLEMLPQLPKRQGSPRQAARSSHLWAGMSSGETVAHDFMTVGEAAIEARVSAKRLRTLMSDGTLREGVHFTRPAGLRPRIIRQELLRWLHGHSPSTATAPSRSPRRRSKLNQALISAAPKPPR